MLSIIAKWILQNNMLIILVALGSIFVTSAFKPLIKKGIKWYQNKVIEKYNTKNGEGGENKYNEKWYNSVLTFYCNLCITVLVLGCVIFWYCRYLRIYDFYVNFSFYLEVLASIAFAKVVYTSYEGVGGISLKELLKKVLKYIYVNINGSVAKTLKNYSNEIIDIIDKVIPLTELGKEDLLKAFKGEDENGKEENKIEKK